MLKQQAITMVREIIEDIYPDAHIEPTYISNNYILSIIIANENDICAVGVWRDNEELTGKISGLSYKGKPDYYDKISRVLVDIANNRNLSRDEKRKIIAQLIENI